MTALLACVAALQLLTLVALWWWHRPLPAVHDPGQPEEEAAERAEVVVEGLRLEVWTDPAGTHVRIHGDEANGLVAVTACSDGRERALHHGPLWPRPPEATTAITLSVGVEPPVPLVLAGWSDAVRMGGRAGLLELPSEAEVLSALGRGVEEGCRWWALELGRCLRATFVDRGALERTEVAARKVLSVAAAAVASLDESVELRVVLPRGVSGRDEHWLVDEQHARKLGNTLVNGVLQPVALLRPALFARGECVVEGEVA